MPFNSNCNEYGSNDNSIKLYYNTEREKLQMPEYGRIVLNMVEQVKAIPDRDKRSEQARAVVGVMETLNLRCTCRKTTSRSFGIICT